MKIKYNINNIKDLKIDISSPSIIFLKGDLGAGKTTLSKHIINNILKVKETVTSPTYTYYNKFELETQNSKLKTIYHFDLYRLKNYDEFFAIGAEEILDNNTGIILIEWPEIIQEHYKPDLEITINKTNNDNERELIIKSLIN